MRIFLIGYMGSGKTTVGKRLARTLNYSFVDLDMLFEEKYKISVVDFFEKYDEEAFRQIEATLIKECSSLDNTVISTGGGAPCYSNNIMIMNELGVTIYLKMTPKALESRLLSTKKSRPLIAQISEDELESYITENLEKRTPFYNRAKLIVDGLNCDIDQIAELIYMHPSL